ncbi:MAG: hypothetical protein LBP33_04835 [Candidatus Adiutrix sp.]|jgi:TRAP-type C4-dicarboxylate transport system substrate-binding protein|nr:hypothetical protein [Candidatus Adiutrix sp.]
MGKLLTLAFAIMLAVPAAAFAQDDKVYELAVAWNDIWGPKFRASQVYRPGGELERRVFERTGGRVKLKIISKMFPTEQLFQAVATGKVDIADVAMPWESSTYPLWNWGEVPGIVDSSPPIGLAEEEAVYSDPKVRELYDQSMAKYNLKFWFVTQWDPANGIWSKGLISGLADLANMKVRAGGYFPTVGLRAIGGTPVSVSGSELGPAMISGTIDGVLTSLGFGYSIGLAQVSKQFTLTPLSPTWSAVTVINKKKFDSLPKDLQEAVIEAGLDIQRAVNLSTIAEYILSTDILTLANVKVAEFPESDKAKLAEASKAVEKEWLDQTGKEGEELLAAVRAAVNKYRSFGK